MPSEENFTLTSGKEVTVSLSDSGEPEKFSWIGASELSENEVTEIYEWLEDYEDEGND